MIYFRHLSGEERKMGWHPEDQAQGVCLPGLTCVWAETGGRKRNQVAEQLGPGGASNTGGEFIFRKERHSLAEIEMEIVRKLTPRGLDPDQTL